MELRADVEAVVKIALHEFKYTLYGLANGADHK